MYMETENSTFSVQDLFTEVQGHLKHVWNKMLVPFVLILQKCLLIWGTWLQIAARTYLPKQSNIYTTRGHVGILHAHAGSCCWLFCSCTLYTVIQQAQMMVMHTHKVLSKC